MARILDLSVFGNDTLDIKLPNNGAVLHLRKPTQAMVIAILDFQRIQAGAEPEEIMRRLDIMTAQILRTNDIDMPITDEYVTVDLNTAMKVATCQYYAAWITEVQSDPNLPSPPCPTNAE